MSKRLLKDNRVRTNTEGLKVAERLNNIITDLLENDFNVRIIKGSEKDFKVILIDLEVEVDIFLNLGSNYYNNELFDEVEETYLMRITGTNFCWVGGNEDEFENDFFDLINFVSKENLKESCISSDFQRAVTGISNFVSPASDKSSDYNEKYNTFKLDFYGKKYASKLKDGSKK